MPMLWTSVCVSSSQSSMCDEATRISCGPVRVPGTYDVVRSKGIGRMTTRAASKSTVVGVVPPNAPTSMCSYSNGSFDIVSGVNYKRGSVGAADDVLQEGVVADRRRADAVERVLR